jgi:hypothetical protein
MAQSAITVTPPNPTPPTNFSFLGTTPPTAPAQAFADDGTAGTLTVFAAKSTSADNTNFPSLDAEGKGTETVVTAASPNPGPGGQLVTFSCLGNYTTVPNQQHASSLTPQGGSIGPITLGTPSSASGPSGTYSQTVTGTGFTKQSVVYVNGVAQTTTFTSSTSITAPAVTKKTSAGTWPVKVVTGGAVETPPVNWVFT